MIGQVDLAAEIESSPSFSEILAHTSSRFPQKIFLIQGENEWTYDQFNGLVNQCCRYFEDLELRSGDILSVILRNSVDYLVVYFAAIRSRIILNPFPYHLSGNEVLSKVANVEPAIIICHKSHFMELSASRYKIENLDEQDFQETLKKYSESPISSIPIKDGQTAILYYSSGTTASPKIIEYTHKSMVLSQASMLRSGFSKPDSVHLAVLPLGHTAVLRYTIKQCVCTGSTIVLYESFWKLRAKLWEEVEKHKATFMEVVPTILIATLKTPYNNFKKEQTSSMDFIGCGSSYLPQNLQEDFEKKFGIPVANLYGLSETGATHFDNPMEPERKTGNIGRPFDIVDIKIFNNDGREAKYGEVGEFGIRGAGLFKGYFKNRQLFDECIKDGYFMTGDLGQKDENGVYYYVDRIKDLIIKGGVNIAPAQIDEVLQSHPGVEEVATIGKPDIMLGESIKSFIVLKNGANLDSKQLMAYCTEQLGDFKTPSEFEFIAELPKGPSGKILKRELREKEFNR